MTSTQQQKITLPYFEDSSKIFQSIANKPWSVFLDSGYPYTQQGRYDVFATDPVVTLVTTGNTTKITEHDKVEFSEQDPFFLLKKHLNKGFKAIADMPFNGGAIGYFSYDLARRLEKIPVISMDEENIPDMMVGIYPWAVIVDHQKKKSHLVANEIEPQMLLNLIEQFSSISTEQSKDQCFSITEKPSSNMDKKAYQQAFEKIKHYLKEGDTYQVNLAQRFCAQCTGNPWFAYKALRKINSAPFSAYLNMPEVQVLSSSPERFLKVREGEVESKPIKGTRPRLNDQAADKNQIITLSNSKKDKAENVMIVDLLRNDISKSCQEGSVKVSKLFEVESFATVHHLVSTVKGILADGQHAIDLLKSCFPGGSITGAPKIRAMEIIEELEPNRRGVYCGSIGYIGFDGNMDSNIAIRTLVHSNNNIRFWAGGGIVNDSVMEDEYQESFDKADALLGLLEQFRQ
ncbi:MAG: aminodeoxychorismate synthase component I [Methylococcales bacterium]|nr:aminodeoxychorismate synthase component I [Methylococcales bacterium]